MRGENMKEEQKFEFSQGVGMSFINKLNFMNLVDSCFKKNNQILFNSKNNINKRIRKSKISGE